MIGGNKDDEKEPPPESTVDSDYGGSSFDKPSKGEKPEPPKPGLKNSEDNEAAKK